VLAARPAHRPPPVATIEDRWAMLTRALAGEPRLIADDREVRRAGASYTVETLEALRAEHGAAASLAWIVGWDAYLKLPSWHRFDELLRLSHLIVVRRPGEHVVPPAELAAFEARRVDGAAIAARPAGGVVLLDATMRSISSSEIRARCRRGEPVADLLPPAVWTYITDHRLYGVSRP
jgi:nicotinate-nucleotide adenylyltransferase